METIQDFKKALSKNGFTITNDELEKCRLYAEELALWQQKINLVGPSTINHIYTRHILDAMQLIHHVPRGTVCDVGTGAGLPGIILAIFLEQPIYLCERIHKKTTFLKNICRKLSLSSHTDILTSDIQSVNKKFDALCSRAVCTINEFLSLTIDNRQPDSLVLLQKGHNYKKELDDALKNWYFNYEAFDSITNEDSKTLLLRDIKER